MISRFFALFVLALTVGWPVAVHAAIGTQGVPAAAVPAPRPDVERGGEIQLAQAMPPQCVAMMSNKPDDLKEQLEWFKELR